MAFDKIVDSAALDAGLLKIAEAIREKGGTGSPLSFPDGMEAAVLAIAGGGLPIGVSKLAAGTFVLETDSASSGLYEIEHGMGATPNFYILSIKGNVSAAEHAGYVCSAYCIKMTIGNVGTAGAIKSITADGGSSSHEQSFVNSVADVMFNSEKFGLLLIDKSLKAGVTYTWVCGVLDGMV